MFFNNNNQKITHLFLAAISGLLALMWAFIYSKNHSTLALIWVIIDIITMAGQRGFGNG